MCCYTGEYNFHEQRGCRMGFPGAHNVRRRPQGLGAARDVSAPRIGDRAHCREHRTTQQNDGRHHPGRSAERHVRCAREQQARRPSAGLGHAANRCSGACRGAAIEIVVDVRSWDFGHLPCAPVALRLRGGRPTKGTLRNALEAWVDWACGCDGDGMPDGWCRHDRMRRGQYQFALHSGSSAQHVDHADN